MDPPQMCFKPRGTVQQKVLLLGVEGVGKTTLFNWFAFGEPGTPAPTESFSKKQVDFGRKGSELPEGLQRFQVISVKTGKQVPLQQARSKPLVLSDLSGQQAYRERWVHHFGCTRCILYLLDQARDMRQQLADLFDNLDNPALQSASILVCLNMTDTAKGGQRLAKEKELLGLLRAQEELLPFLDDDMVAITSLCTKTGAGVQDAADFICGL